MSLDVTSVLSELARRRSDPDDTMDVALMTLVTFFESAEVGAWLRDRIRTLAAKNPCRVIVLDGTQPETILTTDGDWMEFGVKGAAPETLQSAVGALALPQAPLVLIWAAVHIGTDVRFAGVSPSAQTIVHNSSALGNDETGLRDLLAFVQAHPDVTFSDVAYLRLTPWQESIAFFFDAKNVIGELFDLRRVEISSGSLAEAYYLLGWLASRLEWTPSAADRFRNRFGTEIAFTIERAGPPRRIRRVALHSARSHFVAELSRDDPEVIALEVSGAAQHPDRCHPIVNVGTAALIERAILTGHHDRVFSDTLQAARDILARASGRAP